MLHIEHFWLILTLLKNDLLLYKSPNSVQMPENTDQKNSK